MWLENLFFAEPSDAAAPATRGSAPTIDIVTGAFGFSGKYVAARLLQKGHAVRTLTNRAPDTPSGPVEVAPLDFSNARALVSSLRGGKVLYNSYWVRFSYHGVTHANAVANSKALIRAAEEAGIERMVHVSITNPSLTSDLPYFRGKAQVEEAICASSLSYAILRPAVLFGNEDILINNIAWLLRRSPVFAIPGRGDYRLQPIFVDDLAALAVQCGQSRDNLVMDAVGPEAFSYDELVRLIRDALGSRSRIVHLPPWAIRAAAAVLGQMLNDVVLTSDELTGLMRNLLVSQQRPAGSTSLKAWLTANARRVGMSYASELARHYR